MEICFIYPCTGDMNKRGWGDLLPGTPMHLAIPGKELEVLLMDNDIFGGKDNIGQTGTAGTILNNGCRSRGFMIEFDKVTPLVDADLH